MENYKSVLTLKHKVSGDELSQESLHKTHELAESAAAGVKKILGRSKGSYEITGHKIYQRDAEGKFSA
jgi:hypothetical protein